MRKRIYGQPWRQLRICFQSSSESTAVFFGKYWSTFREVLESFPEGTGEISVRLSRYFPRNGPGSAETNRKKSSCLIPLIDIHLSVLSKKILKKSVGNVWKLCFTALLLHPLSRGKVTRTVRHGDGPGRKKKKNFRKSLAVQKNSLPLRSRSERERQEKRSLREFFIPTKVVQVSRPDGCPDRMSRQLNNGY